MEKLGTNQKLSTVESHRRKYRGWKKPDQRKKKIEIFEENQTIQKWGQEFTKIND